MAADTQSERVETGSLIKQFKQTQFARGHCVVISLQHRLRLWFQADYRVFSET